MRINKLFHWLYFVLMSLPIFAILSAVLVSTFNMSTKEESEIHYKYETNDVNDSSDLIIGNIYQFDINNFADYERVGNTIKFGKSYVLIDSTDVNTNEIIYLSTDTTYIILQDNYIYIDNDEYGYAAIAFDIVLDDSDVITINNTKVYVEWIGDLTQLDGLPYNYLIKADYIPIDYVETHNVSPQDVFYNSLDKVANSPFFTWAQASFLGVPVSYLGGIFGLASNSVINILLCYWVAISIIWLMFDVLMFVPMLVHKSIDKARF